MSKMKKKMKICVLDPSGSGFGYVHQLCQSLVNQGCDVHLFTSPCWNEMAKYFRVDYCVHQYFYKYTQKPSSKPGIEGKLWKILRLFEHFIAMIRTAFKAVQFDVIHIQWLTVPIFDITVVWVLSKLRPIVYTVHDLYANESGIQRLEKILLKLIYDIPDALIAHSAVTINGLICEFRVRPTKIYQVNHGNFDYLLKLSMSDDNKYDFSPIILFFGNIRRNKGLDVAIKAMGKVTESIPSARLQIVGVPRTDMAEYETLVAELGLSSNVQFMLGYITENKIPEIFKAAAVVVLPYRSIDQSGVAVTACTFGKSLVVTDVGGIKELVEMAKNGIIVPVDDDIALAEAIIKILTNRPLREQFEKNSRRYSESALDWETIATKTLRIYQIVVKNNSK